MPQPPGVGADAMVTLSNLRRVKGFATDELEVDYEFTAGAISPARDVIVVKTPRGIGEVRLGATAKAKGTVRIKAAGLDKLKGQLEVWMERKNSGPPGARGTVISNSLTLE